MNLIEKNYLFFKENFKEITNGHVGEFVVIEDCEVKGYFPDIISAVSNMDEQGKERGSYIVQQCFENINDGTAILRSRAY